MLEAFVAGLVSVFTWPAFGFMLIGIGIGLVVGLLPGLGGTVALALLLPFTFDLAPIEAFALLLGTISVTATTGDLTSILFGVPGEGTSAALVVDGHPMAKQGQAGRAIGAALVSSLFGAIWGALALALLIPVVRPLVLAFGSPEFFMLTILGIAFVSVLSAGAPLKGLIAAGMGLMLAMVGVDPQMGSQRYTLGQLPFWDGIGLIPVTLGLFAIPEIVDLALKGTSISSGQLKRIEGVANAFRESMRHFWLMARCSSIGTFIGLIPGLGGSVAQWVAYAHAVQSSPNRERFGRGAIEGVLGPGAANNSKEGGALIPTIAFGVPGSISMALLLGAFLIQGLQPGPQMLTTELDLTMSFVWIIVISNVITVGLCLLLLRQLAKLTLIRAHLLIPVIILLVYVGAFAEENQMLDLGVMLVFGVVGLAMTHFGWPRPPLLLGLVLGRLAENYFFLSVTLYGFEWLLRPLVVVLIAMTVAVVFSPALRRRGLALPSRFGRVPKVANDEEA